MERLVYFIALALVRSLQALPLRVVAHLGRFCGGLVYWLDKRHRRVALDNLRAAFASEMSDQAVQALAREHFRRIGESYCTGIKTACMPSAQLAPHLELVGFDQIRQAASARGSCIVAIGHFGNFELYARAPALKLPQFTAATTYRALKQPYLNKLLLSLRSESGCLFFERRKEGRALLASLSRRALLLGILSDQHAGRRGVQIPFFGRPCSTTIAPALLAIRYKLPLFAAICFRPRLAQWRIEIIRQIPTVTEGQRRSAAEIMSDVNATFEEAVRCDPANWFWVHNRWKQRKEPLASPLSATLPGSTAVP